MRSIIDARSRAEWLAVAVSILVIVSILVVVLSG